MSTNGAAPLRRLPIESTRPIVIFAWTRLGLTLMSIALVVALSFPYSGRLAVVLAAVALPWSLVNLLLAQRAPALAVSPLVAIGDVVMLVAIELVAPETYAAVRFMAIAFLAVHAHFQGERLGLAVAAFACVGLVGLSILSGGGQVHGRLLLFYEAVFAAAVLSTAVLVGGFRTAESASRLRARELTRRTMRRDGEIWRCTTGPYRRWSASTWHSRPPSWRPSARGRNGPAGYSKRRVRSPSATCAASGTR